jgi:hypothetical protein
MQICRYGVALQRSKTDADVPRVMIAVVLGATTGRPGPASISPAIEIVLVVFLVVGFAVSLWRVRKRGPGVRYVPRRYRQRVNAWYRGHGWDEPFDEEGNRRKLGWW